VVSVVAGTVLNVSLRAIRRAKTGAASQNFCRCCAHATMQRGMIPIVGATPRFFSVSGLSETPGRRRANESWQAICICVLQVPKLQSTLSAHQSRSWARVRGPADNVRALWRIVPGPRRRFRSEVHSPAQGSAPWPASARKITLAMTPAVTCDDDSPKKKGPGMDTHQGQVHGQARAISV
jgi:hypothetical protein